MAGRIDYISNPTRQEHLYATYETNPEPFWNDLAKENQVEFFHSGRDGQCVEARELIIALPEQLMKLDSDALLKFSRNTSSAGMAWNVPRHFIRTNP